MKELSEEEIKRFFEDLVHERVPFHGYDQIEALALRTAKAEKALETWKITDPPALFHKNEKGEVVAWVEQDMLKACRLAYKAVEAQFRHAVEERVAAEARIVGLTGALDAGLSIASGIATHLAEKRLDCSSCDLAVTEFIEAREAALAPQGKGEV